MKIPFEYIDNKDKVIVFMVSENLQLSDLIVFDYEDFFKKYKIPGDLKKLREDMIDTFVSNNAGIPYTKKQLMDEMHVGVYSDLMKHAKTKKLLRVRFYIDFEDCDNDFRPVIWPIKYPYWCSGENDTSFVLVAYVDNEDQLFKQWPEAHDLDIEEVDKIEFTSRFQRPEWYTE